MYRTKRGLKKGDKCYYLFEKCTVVANFHDSILLYGAREFEFLVKHREMRLRNRDLFHNLKLIIKNWNNE